jgi:3-oxoacyl-[acyl-carrier protein] reductase
VALLTGAGRGIGRAAAEALAAGGMSLGLVARSAGELEATRDACVRQGVDAVAITADVADAAAVAAAVARTERELGPIDLLVSNAGVSGPEGPLWETGFESWWRTVQVNLGGALAAAAAVLPGMVGRGRGRIVQMNTLAATQDHPRYGAYAVAKAGMLRLGGVLAASLASTPIKVFDISPGLVRTDLTSAMPMWAEVPDDDWTPATKAAELVTAIAEGRLDALSGRFIHARDDWAELAARAAQLVAADSRTLRLTSAGADDPLFR